VPIGPLVLSRVVTEILDVRSLAKHIPIEMHFTSILVVVMMTLMMMTTPTMIT